MIKIDSVIELYEQWWRWRRNGEFCVTLHSDLAVK